MTVIENLESIIQDFLKAVIRGGMVEFPLCQLVDTRLKKIVKNQNIGIN